MDLGLGNLITVKEYILPASQVGLTTHDVVLTIIGKGVAEGIDKFCNRKFARLAGAIDQFDAQRDHWILNRYPVEAITTFEQRDDMTAGWVTQTLNNVVQQRADDKGLILFGALLGNELSQCRVTYTGGYWYDTTEDNTGVMPGGATLLPKDISLAWLQQCQEVWSKRDKIGLNIVSDLSTSRNNYNTQHVATFGLLPAVKATLGQHRRQQVT